MKRLITGSIVWIMLWLGCGSDKESPEVQVTNPANGAVVSGTVSITAEASDNKGVEKVEFYVDGALASTSTPEPYSYSWLTTSLQDSSSHSIYAKAYDAVENEGVSATVSVIVYNGGGGQQLVWSDGFESYSAGFWPSANWTNSGNDSGYVDNGIYHSGTQSLKLYGVVGGGWATLAHRSIATSAPWTLECYVRNGTESIPQSGCRASIELNTNPSWTSPRRLLLSFRGNGYIYSGADTSLVAYQTATWYKVKIQYEYPVSGQVRLTYWINDNQIAQENLSPISEEASLSYLSLGAQAGSAWFDDVSISH